jgi:CheY-like chemotaxis protein
MPRKILLADDSVTIQKVVELTFSEGDYQVTCVSNGKMAVDQLDKNRPDIIICDIIMPEMSGYDVAELVKKNPVYTAIPVILLTGTFEPFDEDRARKSGAEAYVTKPFDSKMLVEKVESLLAAKVQFSSSQAVAPVTMFQGGKEYQLPGVVTEDVVKELDVQAQARAQTEVPDAGFNFPDVEKMGEEMPSVAPPPPELEPMDIPEMEDMSIPGEKGEAGELKGFDALMEPPMEAEMEPVSVLEATASSVPTPAPEQSIYESEAPRVIPSYVEPQPTEQPSVATEQVQQLTEEPKIESFASDFNMPEISDSAFDRRETAIDESSIPDLPDHGVSEAEVNIDEIIKADEAMEEPAAAESAVEAGISDAPVVEHEPERFFEPPAFEEPPELPVEKSAEEEPQGFMDFPAISAPMAQDILPDASSLLITDLNEQAMMVAEGQKKIDEEKAAVVEDEFEEAQEYPIHQAEEPAEEPHADLPVEAPAPAAAPSEIRVSPEMLEEIVRKVVSDLAPGIVTNIAWEVIPELANSLIKKRIEELEKEAE